MRLASGLSGIQYFLDSEVNPKESVKTPIKPDPSLSPSRDILRSQSKKGVGILTLDVLRLSGIR